MPLFQQSVLRKYLNDLNKGQLQYAWQQFRDHFHNQDVQTHIRDSKEEEYQEGFVRDLFVKVLGYTLKPQPDYNLVLEKKTEADATKSDGALLRGESVIGVIELKDTDTTELDSIEKQVFGYKHKHKSCVYVITSNFEKLRFYINDAIEWEEFNLFQLTEERFSVLWLCLQQKNISDDIPLKMKQASETEEENITKKLYADYSKFKKDLFANIAELNPRFNKVELFKKTQKLLDRLLFILFAEDRLLVPPNSVREILKQWEQLKELDNYVPLYDRLKKYFGYLNTGHEGKQYEIYAYNGGLFIADEILDNIKIDDALLFTGCKTLSDYDYESEIDVNILGHIFEHSLSEIEEVQAELEGKPVEKNKTKRKKDGVFYTPRYITKYIVENTVGELCRRKKEELNISDEEFSYRKRKDKKRENIYQQLEDYRKWLFSLTICDPACGSGAFLNQALEFLIAEHRYIDELKAKLLGDAFVLSDVETTILENNLFGVDINEEAVEIARLSLWLRTARKGRKLNDLSKNIKCGNSLIDDPKVAGDKAFNWEKEFPEIFKEGGFDVVIGNPPYVRNEMLLQVDKGYFEKKYKTFTGKSDLYVYFFEKGLNIVKSNSLIAFIASSKYTKTKYGKALIEYINENSNIISFIDFKDLDIFSGIVAYPSTIVLRKSNIKVFQSNLLSVSELNQDQVANSVFFYKKVPQTELFKRLGSWSSDSNEKYDFFKSLGNRCKKLSDLKIRPQVGIKTGLNSAYIYKNDEVPNELKNSNLLKPYILGKEVKRYFDIESSHYLFLPYFETEERLILIEDFPFLTEEYNFYLSWKDKLSKRAIISDGIKNGTKKWYELQQIKTDFNYKSYIIYPDISKSTNFTIANNKYYDMTCFGIENDSLQLLGILNSRLVKEYLEMVCVKAKGGYLRLKSQYINNIPIPSNYFNEELKSRVQHIISQTKNFQEVQQSLFQLLQSKYEGIKISNKLEDWPSLSFKDFLKELKKNKLKLSLTEEAEWMKYFEEQKAKANAIQQVIDKTDKEIDQMVYELYGLTEEEIKIVEGEK